MQNNIDTSIELRSPCIDGVPQYSAFYLLDKHSTAVDDFNVALFDCEQPGKTDCDGVICEVKFDVCYDQELVTLSEPCVDQENFDNWVTSISGLASQSPHKFCFFTAGPACVKIDKFYATPIENGDGEFVCMKGSIKACSYRDFDLGGS